MVKRLHPVFHKCVVPLGLLALAQLLPATPVGPIIWGNMNNGGVFTSYTPPDAVSTDVLPSNQLNYGTPTGANPPQHSEFLSMSPIQICYGTACPDANPFSRPGGFLMGGFYAWSQPIEPGTGINSAEASISLVHDFNAPGQQAEGTPTMYTVDKGAYVSWWFVNADGSFSNVLNVYKSNNVIVDLWGVVIGDENLPVKTYNILGFSDISPRDGFISQVPEPGTAAVVAGGLALLIGRQLRRRRSA